MKQQEIPLGQEKLDILAQAKEAARGKSGLELMDVLLEYGERLSADGPLKKEEKQALFALIESQMSQEERLRYAPILHIISKG